MVSRRFRTATFAALTLSFALVATAQRRPVWEFLGEANVDGSVDHDNIVVTGRAGTFKAIQLRVQNNTVQFQRVVVHYGNGQNERIPVAGRIRPGGSTRVIDLPGDRRVIESVELWYSRANWGPRRPKVQLYGLR
jgi:Protein of unknown function (DUF2541)